MMKLFNNLYDFILFHFFLFEFKHCCFSFLVSIFLCVLYFILICKNSLLTHFNRNKCDEKKTIINFLCL